jgi:hypothetical protein
MVALSAALQDSCVSEGLGRLQQQAGGAPATAAAAGVQIQTPQLSWRCELTASAGWTESAGGAELARQVHRTGI